MELFINRETFSDDTVDMPSDYLPVMAFVPKQTNTEAFEKSTGFNRGTLFKCLDKPFPAGEKL